MFVEVNEMGQFLWLEELCPELRLLDPFCEFLIQARPDFTWRRRDDNVRFLDFRDPAARRQEEVLSRLHVKKPMYQTVSDTTPLAPA